MPEIPVHIDTDSAITAVISILTAARDGKLTNEEAAAALDELVDTGPWDALDDPLFLGLVQGLDALVPDKYSLVGLLSRDPVRMRERAVTLRAEGKVAKADRLDARAAKVEAKRS
jgi:hypothetical protein